MGKIYYQYLRKSYTLPLHVIDFRQVASFSKPELFKSDRGRKARPKFVPFNLLPRLGVGWARCLSEFYQFGAVLNVW